MPTQGLFRRAFPSVFGHLDLTNEPTVDYNDTVFSVDKSAAFSHPQTYRYSDAVKNTLLLKDIFSEALPNRETRDDTSASLPTNYPGKFKASSDAFNANQRYIDREINSLEDQILRENAFHGGKLRAAVPRYSPIDYAPEDRQLDSLLAKIGENNAFLSHLGDLAEVNDGLNSEKAPKMALKASDFELQYNTLRKDYLEELSNHQVFYRSYQKLLLKYNSLKDKVGSSLSDAGVDTTAKLRSKVKLIRSRTTENSVKALCDNLLIDLNSQDTLINSYRVELDRANLRISELEKKVQETNKRA